MISNLPIIKIESLTVNSVRDSKFVFYLSLSIYHTYEVNIKEVLNMDIDDIFDSSVDWSEVNADCDFCGLDD